MKEDRSASLTFDAKAALKAVKSREGMIAFAGFSLRIADGPEVEGLMKISEISHAYRGEALILTFILDADASQGIGEKLEHRFSAITKDKLDSVFGNSLERFTSSCLMSVEEAGQWPVFEFQIVFRAAIGQKKTLVEKDLVPLLEQWLPCRFQSVEWWPQTGGGPTPKSSGQTGIIQTWVRKWFA